MLLDWGATLFNQRPIPAVKPKRSKSGLYVSKVPKKAVGGQVGKGVAADAKKIRSKLGSIAKRPPEVMVKISGGGKGMRQIKDHLDYISRNGQIELEDQEGDVIVGKDGHKALRDEWRYGGFNVPEEGTRREAFNIVFSMPEGTDPLAVKRAVRDFAAREFADHQYVMALHTFDTDPDPKPSRHPHVHVCVKATSFDGTRLNPRKGDLQRWREGFAEALREHGVEAAATNRLQRLKRERGEKQSVRQMRERGQPLEKVGQGGATADRVERAKVMEAQVLRNYKHVTSALARSEDVEDRKLARDVIEQLKATTRRYELEKSEERDGGRSR
jgi:hypothetical protein